LSTQTGFGLLSVITLVLSLLQSPVADEKPIQSLDLTTIQRLKSLQLVTESHDQGFCDNEAAGAWTWFEVSLMENADETLPRVKNGIELTWSSHKNVLNNRSWAWVSELHSFDTISL
jgi:hypothetical protein